MEPERRLSCEHDSGRPASRPVCNPCLRESVKSWGFGGEAPIMERLPFPPRASDRRPLRLDVERRRFATRGHVAEAFATDSPESSDPLVEADGEVLSHLRRAARLATSQLGATCSRTDRCVCATDVARTAASGEWAEPHQSSTRSKDSLRICPSFVRAPRL